MKQEATQESTQKVPQREDLIIDEKFTYEFFQTNRYVISQSGNNQALCNNGFTKLYSKLCRVYWHAQNQFSHEVSDWKFHISVAHKDLKKAWNLVAALFFKMKCRAGMKAVYLKQAQKPQRGREITLYLIKYDPKFKESSFAGDFGLDIDIEHSEQYWLEMCKNIEKILESYGIESNGLAEGDYPLGKYISLRNEAFIKNDNGESIYPPNSAGWNPLKHDVPINLKKFYLLHQDEDEEGSIVSQYKSFILLGLSVLTVGWWLKFKWNVAK